jgi:hypothetical protein
MKKSKTFISGLLLGMLIASILPVSAAVEEYICKRPQYKIIVNGEEYSNPEQPVLNYNGRTYFPRAFLEALGFVFEWDGELKQAKVITPSNNDTIKEGEGNETMDNEVIYNDDGSVIINGKKYFWALGTNVSHAFNPSGKAHDITYTLTYKQESDTFDLIKWTRREGYKSKEEILIQDIPIVRFPDIEGVEKRAFLEWDYFMETIMPLIVY